MTRAAIYVRISDDREGKALGVERQEQQCRDLAARLGLTVIELYSDNDISASQHSRKVRPAYQRLLADALARRFDVIVAATSSRLTRRPREFEDLLDLNKDAGTTYEYVKSPRYDLSTAAGVKGARRDAVDDAAESDEISERVRDKLSQRRAAGLPHGGQRPFGWELDRVTIREAEAAHIRWGIEQALSGLPLLAVVRGLGARGSRNTRGGEWRHTTLRNVLMNPRHAGLMPDGSPASWPAIVTPEQHRALVRLLSDKGRVTTPGRGGKLHLLSGIALCAVCGSKLRVGGVKGDLAYRCMARASGGRATGYCVARNRDHLEDFVRKVISRRLSLPDARALLAPAETDEQRAAREAAEVAAETLRNRIDEAAAEGAELGMTVRELASYSAPLRAQLAEAEAAATPPAGAVDALGELRGAGDPGAAFLAAGDERQRVFIDTLITLRVGPGQHGNTFNPNGIEVTWR